ncbi:hypothetical protein E2C01_094072 [Portunus trituberculatus]|uniref:Uncharacterized protein n=1 Tax=Portunus trituberculatus TaxID=210409 RepID=A0A5B7JRJ0_PORTR|nr:hypothetical protein [Portunus trituberculatus]
MVVVRVEVVVVVVVVGGGGGGRARLWEAYQLQTVDIIHVLLSIIDLSAVPGPPRKASVGAKSPSTVSTSCHSSSSSCPPIHPACQPIRPQYLLLTRPNIRPLSFIYFRSTQEHNPPHFSN